jgi:GDPmannose 4,6-dehydratase
MKKIALITGATGMDASHLIEFLLGKDYKIYGMVRRSSTDNLWRIKRVVNRIELVNGDMTDQSSLDRIISLVKPDEVYNLAAQSYVKSSWDSPESTFDINALGVMRLLEAVRIFGSRDTRIFQSSSSEQFGKVLETPQNEKTPFYPRSPYGVSKLAGFWIAKNWRESYHMFVSNSISFNHTSYRRGIEFVERKISLGVAKIHLHLADSIELGNIDAKRDWSWAEEFVEYFWRILQHNEPDDFVLSSGETYSVREFLETAFRYIEIIDWETYVKHNPKFMRPAEVDYLRGDSTKARMLLGFVPKMKFIDIVSEMCKSDIERLSRGDVIG